MGLSGGMQGCLAFTGIVGTLVFVWLVVPTEQLVAATFPNVLIVRGFGYEGLEPISHDNSTMPPVDAATASRLNGLYQYDPMFYHKSLDRFIKWEDRRSATIFSCTMFCSPLNTTGSQVMLALVHSAPEKKKNLWYMLEFRDDDANSPVLHARSKFRKVVSRGSPWMTVTPGGEIKPRDLKDVYIVSAWDAFKFDTPLKVGVFVALFVGAVGFIWYVRQDD
eukprot:TRINITY_DN65080_c0_g1_i1.p1 TRINITY_DN65080_c0_g1~~TRINITY_DN65080_c0_g1_i1.p1  ORF type:complete len:221 (-),score=40.00 TRINITY_DN65080_c0_g1_i1:71-733(-)